MLRVSSSHVPCREEVIQQDLQLIANITSVAPEDIDVISENDRIYALTEELQQTIIDSLESEGCLIDYSPGPFGWFSCSEDWVTGIDTHQIIHTWHTGCLPVDKDQYDVAQCLAACMTSKMVMNLRQLRSYC